MATRKQETTDIAERRAEIVSLFLRGIPQNQIGRELGYSPATVSEDIIAAVTEWKAQAVKDVDAAKAIELEKLAGVEAKAWEGYEESRNKVDRHGQRYQGDPNPAFLGIILGAIAQRCKVLGIVVTVKNTTMLTQQNTYFQAGHAMTRERMHEEVKKVLEGWTSKAVGQATGMTATVMGGLREIDK